MEARFLIPCGDMIQRASGAIEKNIWYCVDFVCTYALQDPSPKTRTQVAQLFHLYLDMMYENHDEEVDGEEKDAIGDILLNLSVYETNMFVDFVSELYNQIYRYVVPYLEGGRYLAYSVEHMEVIHNNLLINLEMDEIEPCALNNIPPLDSSI